MNRLLSLLAEHPALLALVPFALAGLGGAALLAMLLAPERHRRAVDRLGEGAMANLLSGAVALGLPVGGCAALVSSGIRPGRGLLALLAFAVLAIGVGVCARRLGERALPDATAPAQLAIGLAALLLPSLLPLCWPLLPVAAVFGMGAWLRARRGPN